uniref:Uncharacterized protein n=1 Tax=Plectus sambesii TaxID=2011161 RepID=A0A914UY92_9BILA
VGFTIVDDAVTKTPVQVKDQFWGEINPEPLYTEETANRPCNPLVGSAADIDIPAVRKNSEVRMVHKQSTISALYTDDGSHGRRPSDSGTLSRASSGRMSRRFSEMLKKRFGRRTSKTPVTQPTLSSQLSENGDLPPSRTYSIPTATKAHFYSDRTSTSSATTDLNDVLSAVHEGWYDALLLKCKELTEVHVIRSKYKCGGNVRFEFF